MLMPAYLAVTRALSRRPLIVAWPVATAARGIVDALRHLGAELHGVVALHPGIGPPLALPADHVMVLQPERPSPDDNVFEHWQTELARLPPAALDHLDPHRRAAVVVPCAAELSEVAGRDVWGATPASARRQVEDKTRIDAIFEHLGLPRLPTWVGPLADAAAAHGRLDQGHGTVWSLGTGATIPAGASGVWPVDSAPQRAHAEAQLWDADADATIRVQPFIAGRPCSIQGIVLQTGVALTRPCELVVLQGGPPRRFHFAGLSNIWSPALDVTAQLEHLAHTIGTWLADTLDWRGGFSLDAVAAPDGRVWPTEVNARMTAGLALLDGTLPGPSLELIERVLRSGDDDFIAPRELQSWIRRSTRRRRFAHLRLPGLPIPPQDTAFDVVLEVSGHRVPATARWTDLGTTGAVTIELDPTAWPPGVAVSEATAHVLRQAAEAWSLPELASLTASTAPDQRP